MRRACSCGGGCPRCSAQRAAGLLGQGGRPNRLPDPGELVACDGGLLNTAIADARRHFARAWPVINSLSGKFAAGNVANLTASEQTAANLLQSYFSVPITQLGDPNLQTVFTVLGNMSAAIGALTPAQVHCVGQDFPGCVENPVFGQTEAFVLCSSWPLYICASAFSRGLGRPAGPASLALPTNREHRGLVMLHELAHVAGACRTPEHYSPSCATLSLGPAGAAGNAEHYACLIRALSLHLSAAAAEAAARRAIEELLQ